MVFTGEDDAKVLDLCDYFAFIEIVYIINQLPGCIEGKDLHSNFTEGVKYSSVNHAVLAQQELGRGIKQGVRESVVWFLERKTGNIQFN